MDNPFLKHNLHVEIEIVEIYYALVSYDIIIRIVNEPLHKVIEKYSFTIASYNPRLVTVNVKTSPIATNVPDNYANVPDFICGYIVIKKQFKKFVEELGLDQDNFFTDVDVSIMKYDRSTLGNSYTNILYKKTIEN